MFRLDSRLSFTGVSSKLSAKLFTPRTGSGGELLISCGSLGELGVSLPSFLLSVGDLMFMFLRCNVGEVSEWLFSRLELFDMEISADDVVDVGVTTPLEV